MMSKYHKSRLTKFGVLFILGLVGIGFIYLFLNWTIQSILMLIGILIFVLIIGFIETDEMIDSRKKTILTMFLALSFAGVLLMFIDENERYAPSYLRRILIFAGVIGVLYFGIKKSK